LRERTHAIERENARTHIRTLTHTHTHTHTPHTHTVCVCVCVFVCVAPRSALFVIGTRRSYRNGRV